MPLWRNGLARWTSNSKVVGSNPISGVFLFLITAGILTYHIAKYLIGKLLFQTRLCSPIPISNPVDEGFP